MREILETEDLVKYYSSGNGVVKAVDHTSLKIRAGEFTAIVGRSGSGKSTLLHMLGGLDRPDSGKVYLEGKDIFSLKEEKLAVFRRRKIRFIFQSYNLIPSLNVWENIVLPIGLDGCRARPEICPQDRRTDRNGGPAPRAPQHPLRRTAAAGRHRQGPLPPGRLSSLRMSLPGTWIPRRSWM